ncbi:MAG: S41 family peptidase [Candidatus Omnitrophica bacterium]|nr:S41 family peptidase [Candidatus Omnitrophota bacterium]
MYCEVKRSERRFMRKRFIILIVAVVFSLGFLARDFGFAEKAQESDDIYKELELFSDAVSLIRADYVEKPDSKELIYGAMKGMLSALDPYSQFMDPDTYNEMKVETEGEFGGIGIEITIKDNLLTIITPIDDTPAYEAGLKAGDRIVKIEDEITRDLTLIEAVKRLRGKPGTKVRITVLREEERKLLDFTIIRSIIKLESIKRAEIIKGNIGYIRLVEFQEKTARDLETNLRKLEKEGMKGLILDLRNNPGGLLDASVGVSDKFLEEGKVIVSTKGRVESQNFVFKSKSSEKHPDYPMVVLINGGSASASEIVAGAIKDQKRGIIIGTKSFGKGSVQTVVPLSDGSAVRLTTSKYFTPSGKSIHDLGIEPDIVIEYKEPEKDKEPEEVKADAFEGLTGAEDAAAVEKVEDKKTYDNQILGAVDVLKGIIIYSKK